MTSDRPHSIKDGSHPVNALSAAAGRVLDRLVSASLPPGLHIVATPIGNLADITLRALSVLARADMVYCEDTRHSVNLLQHYAIQRPLGPYHEHNAEQERPRIIERLARGERVALISDAGTPLISDPGYKLVLAAREAGHDVWSLPGPSAPIAALAVAGLPTDRFMFEGFLPARTAARRARLQRLSTATATLVFFEAANRLSDTLRDMGEELGVERKAVVARELTKLHETIHRGALIELCSWAASEQVKGEIVILVHGAEQKTVDDATILRHLQQALTNLSVRDAAKHVAEELGTSRKHVYQIALKLKNE